MSKDGQILKDEKGQPLFLTDPSLGNIHLENGYYIAVNDLKNSSAPPSLQKYLMMPTGITIQADGFFTPSKFEWAFDTDSSRSDFGLMKSGLTELLGNKQKNYQFKLKVEKGDEACSGKGCIPAKLIYDEYMRVDKNGGNVKAFHRARADLDKVTNVPPELFSD